MRSMAKVLRPGLALLLLSLAWQGVSLIFPGWPSPLEVGRVVWTNLHEAAFREALWGSVRRMAVGYALVMAIGISGGLLLGRFPLADQVLGSLAVALHAIPGAAWVPLAILWFGMTEQAVIFTILLGAVGIVIVSTDAGIRDVPPLIRRAARMMGARGINYFWFVVVPAAIPKILDGLRLAWAFGWRALMAGELLTSVPGLGQLLSHVAKAQQLPQLLAIMGLMALMGMAVDGLIFKRLEREVRLRWGLA